MSDTRFFSLALGRFKNFEARTDGLIAAGDSSPSCALYSLLFADSAGSLAIQNFDDGEEGKLLYLMNVGAGDISFSGGSILTVDSSVLPTNSVAVFINHKKTWFELSRSVNGGDSVSQAAVGDASPSVKGVSVLIFDSAGALTITGLDDGYEGQVLQIVNLSSDVTIGSSVVIQSSGGDFVLSTSDAISVVYVKGSWFALRPAVTGSLA